MILYNIDFVGQRSMLYSHIDASMRYFPRRLLHGIKPVRTEERIDRYLTRTIRRKQMRIYTRGSVIVELDGYRDRGVFAFPSSSRRDRFLSLQFRFIFHEEKTFSYPGGRDSRRTG